MPTPSRGHEHARVVVVSGTDRFLLPVVHECRAKGNISCNTFSNLPPTCWPIGWPRMASLLIGRQQIRGALFERRVGDFSDMTESAEGFAQPSWSADFQIWTTSIARHHQAADGTEKLLLQLHDGQRIECVLLRDGPRRTICISSQVGCAMGCVFCASGLDGVARNLTAGEIVEQMLRLAQPPAERRTVQPHRRHGHGRTAGEFKSPLGGARRGHRSDRISASAIGGSRFPRSACRRLSIGLAELDARFSIGRLAACTQR